MAKHMTITEKVTTDAGSITNDVVLTGSGAISVEETIADSTTDGLISSFALDYSELVGLYLLSTQDITIETNSGSAPGDTIALKANVPLVWHEDSNHACPLTVDVTKLYVTNASGAAATLRIEALVDSTP